MGTVTSVLSLCLCVLNSPLPRDHHDSKPIIAVKPLLLSSPLPWEEDDEEEGEEWEEEEEERVVDDGDAAEEEHLSLFRASLTCSAAT